MYAFFEKGYHHVYVQKDSAYHNLEKALQIALEIGDYDSSLGILDHMIITADYHHDLPKFRGTLQRVDTLLTDEEITPKIQGVKDWSTNYLTWLASYHFETKEFSKAKDLYRKARTYFDELTTESLSAVQAQRLYAIYSSLGTTYLNLGNFELAELNFSRCIELVKTHEFLKQNSEHYIVSTNQSKAQLYTRMGKHAEANRFYITNLNWTKTYYEQDKKFKNNVLNAYQKITQSYIAQDSLKKALYFLEESNPYHLPNDPFYKDALLFYGAIYVGLNENEKALDILEEALAVFTKFRESDAHQDIAEVHGKIAELHLKQKQHQQGLIAIEKGLRAAGNDIQWTTLQQNPDPENVFSKTQLLYLLDVKSQLLQGRYDATKEARYQAALLQTSRDMLATFDLLKSEFDSKLDKQFLAEKAYPIFHRLMETAHKAYEKDASSENLELALNIAEKNKDFLLLEALRNAQATEYGNVPKTVLEKEAQLRAQITQVEKQLFDANATESQFSGMLFNLKQEYYAFLDTLRTKYPKYHQLKYQNRSLDLATLRTRVLDDKGTLISYTMTEDELYAITLDRSREKFLKLPFGEADRENIRKFYRLLSSPSIKDPGNEISDMGHALFKGILQKPLEGFRSENLTIVPDGELHYLPFDLLRENGSYLLETANIGYGNSVTSLLELKEKKRANDNKLLAFAPSFSGAVATNPDRQFGKLLYNDDEVAKISLFYDTETLTDQKATLDNFKAKTAGFNIVHLATHASANDEHPDYSYLAFTETKDSEEGNILYIKDLYNTILNADMVTLSACQTGIGKLQKGQGMLSLSKGFYYAGAKSIVNTLWKINDKSTVMLMDHFYEGLSKGKSKKEALREAKLKYLETTDDEFLKHPYYWAAFVVSGDTAPISENGNWWYLGLGGVLMATLLLVIVNKKRRSGNV
ncbi:CHAT domain-containing protein [Maribacter sp. 2307ULW6-5]|uniref:CHAT domain-containing protein n=1 Tax=Maribacter sp. 2307ULW6-5 TaxID=3386275 RepID=UPI0039BD76EA